MNYFPLTIIFKYRLTTHIQVAIITFLKEKGLALYIQTYETYHYLDSFRLRFVRIMRHILEIFPYHGDQKKCNITQDYATGASLHGLKLPIWVYNDCWGKETGRLVSALCRLPQNMLTITLK